MGQLTNSAATTPVSEYDATKVATYNAALQVLDSAINGRLAISTTGGTTTLTGTPAAPQAQNLFLDVSGTLTSNAIVEIPIAAGTGRNRFYIVRNGTSGAFTLTVRKVGGTGVAVTQSTVRLLYYNDSDIAFADADAGGGGGDFSSNTSTSVDSEIVLFSGTGGKTGKRATGSGAAILTSGVLSALAPGTSGNVMTSNGSVWTSAAPAGGGSFLGCHVWHTADQSINSATETALAFDSEAFDTDTMHDTATNNSRITFTTAGKYMVIASCSFDSNATGYRQLYVKLGGATTVAFNSLAAVNGTYTALVCSTTYDFAATNYIEVFVYQNSGGALNIKAAAAYSPRFMAYKIG